MTEKFPGVGHAYHVDFQAFQVELHFKSETSLTFYTLGPTGEHTGHETVTIAIQPVRDGLFLVTWTEKDGTTVVHLEDYKLDQITTNITDPKSGLRHYIGTMKQIDK